MNSISRAIGYNQVFIYYYSADNNISIYNKFCYNLLYHYTNFTGSFALLIVFSKTQYIITDSRYSIQVKEEINSNNIVPLDKEDDIWEQACNIVNCFVRNNKLYFENYKFEILLDYYSLDMISYHNLYKVFFKSNYSEHFIYKSFIHHYDLFIKNNANILKDIYINKSDFSIISSSINDRCMIRFINNTRGLISKNSIDSVLITSPLTISYITNIRYNTEEFKHLLFDATILITKLKSYIIIPYNIDTYIISYLYNVFDYITILNNNNIYDTLVNQCNSLIIDYIIQNNIKSLGIDYSSTNFFIYNKLIESNIRVINIEEYIISYQSIKTDKEITIFNKNSKKTDDILSNLIKWIYKQVSQNIKITEYSIYKKLELLLKCSDFIKFSFQPIIAMNKNAAIVHYSKYDNTIPINIGGILLLDMGFCSIEGYVTDTTRTLFINYISQLPEIFNKFIIHYTLVLKAYIQIFLIYLAKGSTFIDLDRLIRNIIINQGYNYGHSTGHSLGLFVHESGCTISNLNNNKITSNMVFSIEPGLYFNKEYGIRIEGLFKVSEYNKFYYIEPLNNILFDTRIIDFNYLSYREKNIVLKYKME